MKFLFRQITAIILALAMFVGAVDITAFAGVNNGPVIYENHSYDTIEEALSDYESNGIISLSNSDKNERCLIDNG
jgi:hypothetical protein